MKRALASIGMAVVLGMMCGCAEESGPAAGQIDAPEVDELSAAPPHGSVNPCTVCNGRMSASGMVDYTIPSELLPAKSEGWLVLDYGPGDQPTLTFDITCNPDGDETTVEVPAGFTSATLIFPVDGGKSYYGFSLTLP